jgi:hypothetical protein
MTRVARDDLRKMIQTREGPGIQEVRTRFSGEKIQVARFANFSRSLSHIAGLRWC